MPDQSISIQRESDKHPKFVCVREVRLSPANAHMLLDLPMKVLKLSPARSLEIANVRPAQCQLALTPFRVSAPRVTRGIYGDTFNLDREVGPALTKIAKRVLVEPLLELSFERHQIALPKWWSCGPISQGHGLQSANGLHAHR